MLLSPLVFIALWLWPVRRLLARGYTKVLCRHLRYRTAGRVHNNTSWNTSRHPTATVREPLVRDHEHWFSNGIESHDCPSLLCLFRVSRVFRDFALTRREPRLGSRHGYMTNAKRTYCPVDRSAPTLSVARATRARQGRCTSFPGATRTTATCRGRSSATRGTFYMMGVRE